MAERISFLADGHQIVGDLYLPPAPEGKPAVIVAGPMTSVKEQVTGVYAAALAARGITALAIDHRGFGASAGEPRQVEDWRLKVADLMAALTALGEHPALSPEQIGAAAVCLGCGYATATAARDSRIRSLGLVAGYYRDPSAMAAQDPAGFAAKVEQGRQARLHYEATGEVQLIPAASATGDAAMQTDDTVDYYTRRAAIPAYRNEFAVMSRELFLPFDVQANAALVKVPVRMVHAERALSPPWARKFFDALECPKKIDWIEAPSQTRIYDDPALVAQATDRIAEHFHATL